MQGKDKTWFGQRLWADIIVSDDEADWHVVGLSTPNGSPVTAAAVPPAPSAVPVSSATPEVKEAPQAEVNSPPVVAPAQVVNTPPPVPSPEPETVRAVPPPAPQPEPTTKFARELRVLADMGFSDLARLLPLLREHVEGAENATEGLQRVVAALLSEEGLWN